MLQDLVSWTSIPEEVLATDPSEYPVALAAALSDNLRTAKQELVTQWLDRISARVAISTKRVFPTHELLNHVPLLIEGIAGYLKSPERDIDSKAPVVAKAVPVAAVVKSTPTPVAAAVAAPVDPVYLKSITLEDSHFDFDSAKLKPAGMTALNENIEILKKNPKAQVRVAGYTSLRGTAEYNQRLSERRATAVRRR